MHPVTWGRPLSGGLNHQRTRHLPPPRTLDWRRSRDNRRPIHHRRLSGNRRRLASAQEPHRPTRTRTSSPHIPLHQRHQLELVRPIPALQRRWQLLRNIDNRPSPAGQQPGTDCRCPLPFHRHAHRRDRLPTLALNCPLTPHRHLPRPRQQPDHRRLDTTGHLRPTPALDGNQLDNKTSWFRHNPSAQTPKTGA